MKKCGKVKVLSKFLCVAVLTLALGFFAVGCGVSGNSAIVDIKFTTPVFYIDINCPTRLDYKVYPSTARNYSVILSTNLESGFEFVDGVFTITAPQNFNPVQVTLQCGNLSDVCFVTRKIYPLRTLLMHQSFENSGVIDNSSGAYDTYNTDGGLREVTILAGTQTQFSMAGEFSRYFDIESARICDYGSPHYAEVGPETFSYKMVSSNPTVVSVSEDAKSLSVTGNRAGSAIITAYLANSNGEIVDSNGAVASDLSSTSMNYSRIKVNVVDAIFDSRLSVDGGALAIPETSENFKVYDLPINGLQNGSISFDLYLLDGNKRICQENSIFETLQYSLVGKTIGDGERSAHIDVTTEILPNIASDETPMHARITLTNNGSVTALDGSDRIIITSKFLINSIGEQLIIVIHLFNAT